MNHAIITEGETIANVCIVRHNSLYGCELNVDGTFVCIAPEHSTLTGLFHVLQGKLAEAILRSRYLQGRPAGNGG